MPTGQKAWKVTEVATLRRMYPAEPASVIAKELGRPVKSVYHYAARLGLRKFPKQCDVHA